MVVVAKEVDKFINAVQGVHMYVRVSSEDQQDRETIENQIEFGEKYCDLHKLDIVDWYKDDGISGTIPLEQRPDGKRLIEDAKAGKVKMVLIYNMKRLGRKARVTLDAVYQLEQYGVKVKSMTEPFDTSDPVGRFIITVLAGQAELDRDTMLDTMWHGANRAARKGKWLGGIVPYGYRKDDEGYLEISEEPIPTKPELSEAGVVRLMFELLVERQWSTIQIADYFNDLKIPPSYVRDGRRVKKGVRKVKTAGVWSPGRINNMIRSTTYKGLHIYGKRATRERELIEREVPAIISEERWEAAQTELKSHQIESNRNYSRLYLLRGIIKCGTCGITYVGSMFNGKDKRPTAYYICGGKNPYRGPLQGKCNSRNIPAEWIEEKVWEECLTFIRNPGELIKELSGNMQDRKSIKESLEREIQMLRTSITDKDTERQEIISLFRKKVITAADVEQQLQDMMTERSNLEKRVRELEEQIKDEDGLVQQFDTAEIMLREIRSKIDNDLTPELKREVIRALVKQIIVRTEHPPENDGPGGGIRIPRPPVTVDVHYSFESPRRFHEPLS
ncbi:recombinase family protein, partial [Cohnella lubricantis]